MTTTSLLQCVQLQSAGSRQWINSGGDGCVEHASGGAGPGAIEPEDGEAATTVGALRLAVSDLTKATTVDEGCGEALQ